MIYLWPSIVWDCVDGIISYIWDLRVSSGFSPRDLWSRGDTSTAGSRCGATAGKRRNHEAKTFILREQSP